MNAMLDRRDFIRALAAGAVAAGVPLPVGFPRHLQVIGTPIPETLELLHWQEEWIVTRWARSAIKRGGWIEIETFPIHLHPGNDFDRGEIYQITERSSSDE